MSMVQIAAAILVVLATAVLVYRFSTAPGAKTAGKSKKQQKGQRDATASRKEAGRAMLETSDEDGTARRSSVSSSTASKASKKAEKRARKRQEAAAATSAPAASPGKAHVSQDAAQDSEDEESEVDYQSHSAVNKSSNRQNTSKGNFFALLADDYDHTSTSKKTKAPKKKEQIAPSQSLAGVNRAAPSPPAPPLPAPSQNTTAPVRPLPPIGKTVTANGLMMPSFPVAFQSAAPDAAAKPAAKQAHAVEEATLPQGVTDPAATGASKKKKRRKNKNAAKDAAEEENADEESGMQGSGSWPDNWEESIRKQEKEEEWVTVGGDGRNRTTSYEQHGSGGLDASNSGSLSNGALTKKQKQNQRKAELQKEQKQLDEQSRLGALKQHRQQQEKDAIKKMAQRANPPGRPYTVPGKSWTGNSPFELLAFHDDDE